MSDGRRPKRVAESIRAHLAEQLSAHSEDPRIAHLVVTRVELPADMSIAWVYVRLLIGDEDEKQRQGALRAVQNSAGRLRGSLGTKIRMKRLPELRFHYDAEHDSASRVQQLLEEIERSPKAEPEE